MRHALLLFLLILLAGACRHPHYDGRLDSIITMIPESPFEASDSLDALPTPTSHEDSLRYRLVRTMVQSHLEPYQDTVREWLDEVIRTTAGSGKKDRFIAGVAHLYKGMTYHNCQQEDSALKEYMTAQTLLSDTDHKHWLGLTLREKGNCLNNLHDGPGALRALQDADSIFTLAGDTRRSLDCRIRMGDALYLGADYSSAEKLLKEVHAAATEREDTFLMHESLRALAFTETFLTEYEEVIDIYDKIMELGYQPLQDTDWEKLGYAYLETGDLEMARQCLNEIEGSAYGLQASLYAAERNYQKASEAYEELIGNINSARDHDSAQPQTVILTDHYEAEQRLKNELLASERRSSLLGWASAVLLLAVVILTVLYFRRKAREEAALKERVVDDMQSVLEKTYRQLDENKTLLAETRQQLDNKSQQIIEHEKTEREYRKKEIEYRKEIEASRALIAEKEKETQKQAAEKEEELDLRVQWLTHTYDLFKEYFGEYNKKKNDEDKVKNRLYSKMLARVKELKGNKHLLQEMEGILNNHGADLIATLRLEHPKMSETDIKIVILSIFGFTADTIAYLLGIDRMKVYNRNKALKKVLLPSSTPNSKRLHTLLWPGRSGKEGEETVEEEEK